MMGAGVLHPTLPMPRPDLTRSRIVAAGVSVAHELGLAALDLRTVGRRVNTTATGLRRHIGVTELVDAVVAQIVATMPGIPARGDRIRRLRTWARQTREWLAEYPGLASHLLANRWDVPAALDRLEDVARALADGGLAQGQATSAAVTVFWYVLGSADLDMSPRVIGGHPAVLEGETSPPAEAGRWPLLGSRVGDYSPAATREQFAYGLELILDAIQRPGPATPKVLRAAPQARRPVAASGTQAV